ncbi:DUF2194 domain-containing protein [Paenibacillus contaminans]|uniref:DUF2194 domain-containing protein n=1 Tax=Paenibacillus contaminans TaxID=450362 RepID=A0A329M258_9BACL|nr:DUF2194 domain-containing protein [Paenibacillus contaminans]RAV13828.1 DUF2194 domain-containing protein [Paenibacillus contaminans]
MNRDVKFTRNVYIILIAVLLLAIIIQVARSQYVLKFKHNSDLLEQRDVLLTAAKQEDKSVLSDQAPYCLVYSSESEYSRAVKGHTKKMLEYMQKQISEFDLAEEGYDPKPCSNVLVALDSWPEKLNVNALADYVNNGGYVFFLSSTEINNQYNLLYRKLGVTSFGSTFLTKGIKLTSNVLIGENNMKMADDFIMNSSNPVELDSSVQLLAETVEGTPLIWRHSYGKGAFMVFNGTMLQEKINRGIIAGALSMLEPDMIYPIFNSKLFYIDDFPAPIPKGFSDSIYEEYQRDIPAFFKDIWWPDMLRAANNLGIKYTTGLIQTYHDDVEPPFQYPGDEDRHGLITYGREVIKSGGEIGLHGYNHQSLQMSQKVANKFGYNPWRSQENMVNSIKEAITFANRSFPSYKLMSYIPPSNVLSQEGREALKEAWPDLAVIASLYGEDGEGAAYVQEYEIAKDGVLEMPRVTSGYFERAYDHWAEANTITSLGVFSHFIHPDDVIDEERSGFLTWDELYKDFTKKLDRLQRTYPWLREMISTEAALDMGRTLTSTVKWQKDDKSITGEIHNFQGHDLYYILRTEHKISRQVNCTVKKIDTNTFLVTAHDSKFVIGLGG